MADAYEFIISLRDVTLVLLNGVMNQMLDPSAQMFTLPQEEFDGVQLQIFSIQRRIREFFTNEDNEE